MGPQEYADPEAAKKTYKKKELMSEDVKVNTEALLAKVKAAIERDDLFGPVTAGIKPETRLVDLNMDDVDTLSVIMDLEDLNDKAIEGEPEGFHTVQDIIDAMVKAGITE